MRVFVPLLEFNLIGKDILAIEKKITNPSEIIKQNQGFEISRLLLNQPREQEQHPGIDR
jgi:hypothetical protein